MFERVLGYSIQSTDITKDSPVHIDMDMALDNIVPESLNWLHTDEGPEYVHLDLSVHQAFTADDLSSSH